VGLGETCLLKGQEEGAEKEAVGEREEEEERRRRPEGHHACVYPRLKPYI
jgi:hypothetical protein